MTITEDVDYQKKVMHQLKSRMKELDRMMTYSHVYLENIKHLTEKIQGTNYILLFNIICGKFLKKSMLILFAL